MTDIDTSSPFIEQPGRHHHFGSFRRTVLDQHDLPPNRFDVVCGRDSQSLRHVGNRRFRHIIEMNRERYQTCPSREQKTRISHEIVEMIRVSGGRFIKFDAETCLWEDVGDEYAREKVSHALRSAKDPNRKKELKKRQGGDQKAKIAYDNPVFASLFEKQQVIFRQLLKDEGHDATKLPTIVSVIPMTIDEVVSSATVVSV